MRFACGRLCGQPFFRLSTTRSPLAPGTKVAAASGDDHAANLPGAARAFLPFPLVDAMAKLEFAWLAFGIYVIRNRRTPEANRFAQHFLNCTVKARDFLSF